MKKQRQQREQRGFTLLEVLVALAILAMSAAVLIEIVTNNVRATNHSKLTTAATFLARGKMTDVEDDVITNGFSTDDENAHGTFKDQGYPQFRWESAIERIDLPTDLAKKTQDQAQDKAKETDSAKDPMSMITGFMGGMMSSFIEPIRLGLQESVRRVTVRVFWDESGRPNQTFEVVQYLTDPAKLEQSIPGMTAGGPAPSGSGSANQGTTSGPATTNPGGGLGIQNLMGAPR